MRVRQDGPNEKRIPPRAPQEKMNACATAGIAVMGTRMLPPRARCLPRGGSSLSRPQGWQRHAPASFSSSAASGGAKSGRLMRGSVEGEVVYFCCAISRHKATSQQRGSIIAAGTSKETEEIARCVPVTTSKGSCLASCASLERCCSVDWWGGSSEQKVSTRFPSSSRTFGGLSGRSPPSAARQNAAKSGCCAGGGTPGHGWEPWPAA
jgi:hypothetical protein